MRHLLAFCALVTGVACSQSPTGVWQGEWSDTTPISGTLTIDTTRNRATILRAMPRVTRGVPYVYEEFREDFEFTVEKLVDRVDPPRFFPLVGPAQLHHCHWKCTIYYTETVQSSYPFPVKVVKNRVEVVYIDKDHLHLYVGPNPQVQAAVTRDVAGY